MDRLNWRLRNVLHFFNSQLDAPRPTTATSATRTHYTRLSVHTRTEHSTQSIKRYLRNIDFPIRRTTIDRSITHCEMHHCTITTRPTTSQYVYYHFTVLVGLCLNPALGVLLLSGEHTPTLIHVSQHLTYPLPQDHDRLLGQQRQELVQVVGRRLQVQSIQECAHVLPVQPA